MKLKVDWLLLSRLYLNDDLNLNANNNHLANSNAHGRMAQSLTRSNMKTHKNLYYNVYNLSNLLLAWRSARKGKTNKIYVKEFEKDLIKNLLTLYEELKSQIYSPKPLKTFILRDPKTRKISKSEFRDRVTHHALVRVIEPIFDKTFIYDSCANRKEKGSLFAIKRFEKFARKVSKNNIAPCFVLKADIKHYFQEVNHEILIQIIRRKIKDEKVALLIKRILDNCTNSEVERERERDKKF